MKTHSAAISGRIEWALTGTLSIGSTGARVEIGSTHPRKSADGVGGIPGDDLLFRRLRDCTPGIRLVHAE